MKNEWTDAEIEYNIFDGSPGFAIGETWYDLGEFMRAPEGADYDASLAITNAGGIVIRMDDDQNIQYQFRY
jgi:hypothetical protein